MWASRFLCWHSVPPPACCCFLRFQNSPTDTRGEFPYKEIFLINLSTGWALCPNCLIFIFLLYFAIPPFQRDWAAFLSAWCLLQHSEVVLKLLSIQMIFDEFFREKVVFLSCWCCSSCGLHPSHSRDSFYFFLLFFFLCQKQHSRIANSTRTQLRNGHVCLVRFRRKCFQLFSTNIMLYVGIVIYEFYYIGSRLLWGLLQVAKELPLIAVGGNITDVCSIPNGTSLKQVKLFWWNPLKYSCSKIPWSPSPRVI